MTHPAAMAAARAAMVERQLRARGVTDPRVLAAMGAVPREWFVDPDLAGRAYADAALPSAGGQTISQPLMVALMTQLLAPEPGMRVLEVGSGTGYQAAILALMGCHVTGVERLGGLIEPARRRLDALAESGPLSGDVTLVEGDGSAGWPESAPWPRILVSAGAPRIPEPLTAQLADGGRLVIPVGTRHAQDLVLVERAGARFQTSTHGACVFVPLVGVGGWK